MTTGLVLGLNVCSTESKSVTYSKFGAVVRQWRSSSKSATLSTRVSDLMASDRWVWGRSMPLHVSSMRDLDLQGHMWQESDRNRKRSRC